MYKRILLPTDGSDLSRKAIKKGVQLAKSVKAGVIGFFAPVNYGSLLYSEYIPPSIMSPDEFAAISTKAAREHLAFIEKTAKEAGVAYEGYSLTGAAPWEVIVEAAKKKKCDLIFMASHGRMGLSALMLGSQTAKVLTHSKISVLVYR